jgi:hypothetical protein
MATGFLLIVLGAWQALAPEVGPFFHYGIGHEAAWTWNQTHLVLNVLPGAAVALGGLVMLVTSDWPGQVLGTLLALCGGIWGVLGPSTYHVSSFMQIMKSYGYFYAIGALIIAIAGYTVGRLTNELISEEPVVTPSQPAELERQRSA